MLGILFALVSLIGWGIGDVFGALVSKRINSYSITFWNDLVAFGILTICIPFIHPSTSISFFYFFATLLLSIIGSLPLVAFYEGLRRGNPSLVGTIANSFSALVVILSVIFLHEKLTGVEVIAICIIILGVIITSFDKSILQKKMVLTDKGIKFAFIAMILWAIYFTFVKLPTEHIGVFWTSYIAYLPFPFVYLLMRFFKIPLQTPSVPSKTTVLLLSSILLLLLGTVSYFLGIINGKVSVVAPIANSSPVLFTVLSFLIFKNKFTKQQLIGIFITLAGIVSLSFLSG